MAHTFLPESRPQRARRVNRRSIKAKTQTTSIKAVVEGIRQNKFLLPAIQREFVWKEEQILNFFDSLMRGYPFGTLLFWRIEPEHVDDYRFYAFMTDYHERDLCRCEFAKNPPLQGFTAVLDGQQRLTALNIGFEGTYCTKRRYGRWDNDAAFETRRLYLNLLSEPDEEKNVDYEFAFKPDAGGMFFDTADGRLKWWLRIGGCFSKKDCTVRRQPGRRARGPHLPARDVRPRRQAPQLRHDR